MAASKPRKGGTRTSAFGVGKREGHDSSPFYERFHAPEVSADDTIAAPVADQGICFLYFGGSNSVVSGTFTIILTAAGILTLAL